MITPEAFIDAFAMQVEQSDIDSFNVVPIDEQGAIRAGRGAGGCCVILPPVRNQLADINTKALRIRFNVLVSTIGNGVSRTENACLVEVKSTELATLEKAARVFGLFFKSIDPQDENQVARSIEACLEIFANGSQPSRETVSGLWGELLVMCAVDDIDSVARSWHVAVNETFDFSMGSRRLEVKTSMGNRSHHFSLSQLTSPGEVQIFIASILLFSTAAGSSILDLCDLIERKMTDSSVYETLMRRVWSLVPLDSYEYAQVCFDYQLAIQSIRIFRAEDIPKPNDVPYQVAHVKFQSDLQFETSIGSSSQVEKVLLGL